MSKPVTWFPPISLPILATAFSLEGGFYHVILGARVIFAKEGKVK
jgi:hypothetical protein